MELQLQVTEEELLEFPEVRSDQFNTSHSDKPAGKVVLGKKNRTEENSAIESSIERNSTEKKSSLSSSRSRGRHSADTHSKIKVEKPHYRRPAAHRR